MMAKNVARSMPFRVPVRARPPLLDRAPRLPRRTALGVAPVGGFSATPTLKERGSAGRAGLRIRVRERLERGAARSGRLGAGMPYMPTAEVECPVRRGISTSGAQGRAATLRRRSQKHCGSSSVVQASSAPGQQRFQRVQPNPSASTSQHAGFDGALAVQDLRDRSTTCAGRAAQGCVTLSRGTARPMRVRLAVRLEFRPTSRFTAHGSQSDEILRQSCPGRRPYPDVCLNTLRPPSWALVSLRRSEYANRSGGDLSVRAAC